MNWYFQYCLRAFLLLAWLLPSHLAWAGGPKPAENKDVLTLPPPAWSINFDDYEFSMNMVIRVRYNGTASNNAANLLGVFVGNELRGVATPIFYNGDAYFFTNIYSNVYTGEVLNFRLYYAPDDQIYPSADHVVFLHHKSVGTLGTPFWIDIDPNADFPPELEPILADTTLQNIPFDPIALVDYLISADGDPVTWSAQPGPNLNASIVNGVLTVTPVLPMWIGTDFVRIIVTENTANQYADTIVGLFTVLADYGPPMLQTIPDQSIFPGQVFTSFDLDNYLTFNGDCRQFDLDVFPFTGTAVNPAWPPVPPAAQPMTVIARVLFGDEQLSGGSARLAAFVNGVLAGSGTPTGVPSSISYSLQLQNVGAGPITFKFYDATNQYLYEKLTSLVFTPGGSTGSVAAPYLIQLSPIVPTLAANGEVQIAIADTAWRGSFPVDFIVWDCDFPVQRRDTMRVTFSVVVNNNPQITSPQAVNFKEASCAPLYDTQATDPNDSEGSGLTYSITGGADALKFSINATNGKLSWITPPDFEMPGDANADNQYIVLIRVTNSMNLTDEITLTITVTNNPVEMFLPKVNGGVTAVCLVATASLQATGGTMYSWSNGDPAATITVNTPGIYTVTITDDGACSASITVTVSLRPTITATGSAVPVCIGSNISLKSTPVGGSGTYSTFVWAGPNNFASALEDPTPFPATALAAGIYTVTLTDNAGCTATASTTITVSGSTAPAIVAANNGPLCNGTSVTLTATPSGGSGTYTQYKWAGPNTYASSAQNPASFPISPLNAGTYTVTVTDNAGCTATDITTLQVNPLPTTVAGSNSPLCINGQSIALNSTASGGSGVYSQYKWAGPNGYVNFVEDPGGFPASLAAAGVYTVTVTDNAGCKGTATTTVSVSGLPTITAAVLGPVCTNGMLLLGSTPAGGSGTYTAFQWAGPNDYVANVEDPAPIPVTPSVVGNYVVVVTDQTGCTGIASVSITINSLPAITAANNGPVCENSSLLLSSTPSGGSGTYPLFNWTGPDNYVASVEDPASFSVTTASNGVYQVKVTDSNGCTATATTTAVIRPKPSIVIATNSPVCNTGILNLQSTPSGGSSVYSTFSWAGPNSFMATVEDPPGFAVNLSSTGTYRVTVTDNAGCTATATTNVAVSTNLAPTVIATVLNTPICAGNNITLNATPGGGSGIYAGFSWAGPNSYMAAQQNPTPFAGSMASSGVYTVTVTDSKSCKGTATVSVSVFGTISLPTSNSPLCPGNLILLNGGPAPAGPGVTYTWTGPNGFASMQRNPPGFAATLAAAGTYTLTISDNGCIDVGTTDVFVGDNTPPMITCPANTTINTGITCSSPVGAYTALSVSDNCAANPSVTQSPVASAVISGHNTVQTVTLTANDGNGNMQGCTFTVTLLDLTKPTIVCPAPQIVSANASCGGVVGTYAPVTLSDNCAASPTLIQSPVATTVLNGHNDAKTLTLTANDGNGNTQSCTFTVTLKDLTLPTIVCPANQTVAPTDPLTCTAVISNINAVTNDNCSPTVLTYLLTGASTGSGTGQVSGQAFITGQTTVKYTVTDVGGNTATCTFVISINPCINGRIIWKQDNITGVKDVIVTASGDQNATYTTGLDGRYGFIFTAGNNFMITPAKNINKLNGVDAQDVFRVQQHNSGNLLTNPYQLMAADVNVNNTITPLDANIIQLSILGNPQALAQFIKSWRFVPTTYTVPNPPWGFPEKVNLTGGATNIDFYGIKMGDIVSVFANPANLGPEPAFVLTTPDRVLQAGEDLQVDFQAGQTDDLSAFQLALHFDTQRLQLSEIQSLDAVPLAEENFGTYQLDEGSIKVLWAGMGGTNLPEAAPIFRLKFKVLQSGGDLSESLYLYDDETLISRAYKGNSAAAELVLQYLGETSAVGPTPAQPRLQLLQNQPNPFSTQTQIGFELPESCTAQLRIIDVSGRVLALRNKQYAVGKHSEVFDLENVSGVLYYELTTPFGVLSKKMLVLDK